MANLMEDIPVGMNLENSRKSASIRKVQRLANVLHSSRMVVSRCSATMPMVNSTACIESGMPMVASKCSVSILMAS